MAEKTELTVEQKAAKYDALVEKREGRKGQSAARRKAQSQLIKAHQPEYDDLLKRAGGKAKASAE